MASIATNTKDIKYLNKDFADFKAALVEYAKAYYPNAYNDFSTSSPGTMFIEMASYVGDVLSFYLDNQLQETFLQYAKQKNNLYTLAYMLGYRPKVTSAASVDLDIYQILPSSGSSGNYSPDYNYALIIDEGMQVASSVSSTITFYIPEKINFSVSSSTDPVEVSIYSVDNNGDPLYYLLRKTVKAISGTARTATFNFSEAQKFNTATLQDNRIVEITDVTDSDGNKWYEVPYLAQDTIMVPVQNLPALTPDYASDAGIVPYMISLQKVPRRFVTRHRTEDVLELQFGAGVEQVSDESLLPNPNTVGYGTIDSLSKLNTVYSPANFTATETYGLAPSNTTLTVQYIAGGGAESNVPSNQLTQVVNYTSNFLGGTVDDVKGNLVLQSIAVNNPNQAVGGGDGDTVEQLRQNTLNQYPAQMRAVTLEDYLSVAYSMPGKFGQIAKAYVLKDDITERTGDSEENIVSKDPLAISMYVLSYDAQKKLIQPPISLKQNLKTYVSQYRMLTDSISIKNAYVINIGVIFDIVLRSGYSNRDVLAQCLEQLKDFFNIEKWQINQPIILSDIYTTLNQVVGVQTVQKVEIVNKAGEADGYSRYTYDIVAGTLNGVIYPSLDPSIFEVRYSDIDLQGRVVTF